MALAGAGAVPTVAKATSESEKNLLCACHLSISKICMKYLLNGHHSNDIAYI